jgi:hypothetical protein
MGELALEVVPAALQTVKVTPPPRSTVSPTSPILLQLPSHLAAKTLDEKKINPEAITDNQTARFINPPSILINQMNAVIRPSMKTSQHPALNKTVP